MSRRSQQGWFGMPALVLALGLLSITLLVWIKRIDNEQQRHIARSEAIMDMQFKLTLSHLWLEEHIAGEASVDMKKVWEDMEQAIVLSHSLLKGGRAGHDMPFDSIVQPDLQAQAEDINFLLNHFKEIALDRLREPKKSGIGTPLDQMFDIVFREVISGAAVLQAAAEGDVRRYQLHSKQLFNGILVIWIVIVIVAATGFWKRELQKKAAEETLREARDELERRVEERTRELTTANERLEREVSERRRAEESLRLYEEVVNNMPIGLYVFHLDDVRDQTVFKMIATNPVAGRSMGVAAEDVIGKTMLESFAGLFEEVLPGTCAEVVRSGKTEDLGELRYGNEQASDGFFSVKAFPLPNDCVGVIFENITERKRAEEALRASESNFRRLSREFHTLLDAIPDRITLLAPDMRVLWANRGAADAAGLDVATLTGKTCHEVWHDLSTPCEYCPARKSFDSGRPESAEVVTPGEEFWNVRAYPIRNEEGRVINVIEMTTDVTERITFQAEAMRTAHLASLGELAAGLAHEVNNPTNCVINYARVLSNKSQEGTEQHDIANRIIKEGMRVAAIVKGLLSFARERKEEKAPVRIQEVLKDSLALTASLILKQGIRVSEDLPPDLPEIIVNPQQIQQVFLNIISNARYALNEKYPEFHENKLIEIRGKKATLDGRPCVNISFCDHGSGIPADIMDKIMIPFFSTKPTGEGTGLGLSISHGIVNDHGGKLMVHSLRGDWTEVVVALPAKD